MTQQQEEPEGGTLRGDVAGLEEAARRVEVYLGPKLGWRPFGARRGADSPIICVQQHGRLFGGVHFDIGPAGPLPEADP